ncbi:hydroxypyruvate isomerase family protein [Halopseudomonas bauzanensis]|uniref:hydroxypyruvate isomerase family protein n=1 Tax=Halopseudomonas bauzanensis TaxID=653930 RepID=UPI0035257A6A
MSWPLAANLTMLFADLPMTERFHAAAEAGFDGVEIQFPYDMPAATVQHHLAAAGMPLVLINVPAGDLMTGGPGLAGVPARQAEFDEALQLALEYALVLRPEKVNVLPGRLAEGVSREAALDTLAANLAKAARAFSDIGVCLVCEAVNRHDMPGFLLGSTSELLAMLERVEHPNLSAQVDLYHLARMGESLPDSIALLEGRIGHVQFADAPGRGEPGTGEMDFHGAFSALSRHGYRGWLAAEYRPALPPEQTLQWLVQWTAAGTFRLQGRSV